MDQELFESVRCFLEREKHCSNVEVNLPVTDADEPHRRSGPASGLKEYSRVDVAGGRFYAEGDYKCLELHCVNYVKNAGDLTKEIGRLFWQKFWMSELGFWADRIFFYLLLREEHVTEELRKFCQGFGLGILKIDAGRIVTEALSPADQHGLLRRMAEQVVRLSCTGTSCFKSFGPGDLACPACGASLEPSVFLWRVYGDSFQRATKNRRYQGVPDSMPEAVATTPFLRKLFQNWVRVRDSWHGD